MNLNTSTSKKTTLLFVLLLVLTVQNSCTNLRAQSASTSYSLVTYNVENLFDADGVAVYSDYLPTDRQGNSQYSPADVYTKISHIIEVLKAYEDGAGPDIVTLVELESDHTPRDHEFADPADFLGQYAYTTLQRMLNEEFDEQIAQLPSEWLLLKGMQDALLGPYELEVGEPSLGASGKPESVQKNVVYSKYPILREKTRVHPTERARPILEVWIDFDGDELGVFVNHWKSGAGSEEMERERVGNAKVLKARVAQLFEENPMADLVLAGDFNADYNQKTRYGFAETALQDILQVQGDEALVVNAAEKMQPLWYNLWYEWPIDQRGSDTYRGYWGTLMQLIVSNGMYDNQGLSYVDQSFNVDDFGFNTYSVSGMPKRWSSFGTGSGYSDHLPLSMLITKAQGPFEGPFSSNDDHLWQAIAVEYTRPEQLMDSQAFESGAAYRDMRYYDQYFKLEGQLGTDGKVVVMGTKIDVYAPAFNFGDFAKQLIHQTVADQTERADSIPIEFIGRWSQYRGNWQFVIESETFVQPLPAK